MKFLTGYLSLFLLAAALVSCAPRNKVPYEQLNKLTLLQKFYQDKETLYRDNKFAVRFLDLHAGETLADIGAFDGIWDGIYSVFTDSVTFYIEDITDKGFGRNDSIMAYCQKLRGLPSHSKVIKVLGNETSTNLPSSSFDKVICNESFHHFGQPVLMLAEIKRMLKPGGSLFIRDSLKRRWRKQSHFHYSKKEMICLVEQNGFILKRDVSQRHMALLEFSMK
ncbi:MAG TPA: methyltransferase domain-containing protein [Bacteroidia bacterium]|jgi:SAM-dependent methyltransferase